MSYEVRVTLYCDGDDGLCEERIEFVRQNQGGMNKSLAVLIARNRGWKADGAGRRTLCPKHASQEAQA